MASLRSPMSRPSTTCFKAAKKTWMPATSAGMTDLIHSLSGNSRRASHIHLQRRNEGFLRDVDLAELAHALFALPFLSRSRVNTECGQLLGKQLLRTRKMTFRFGDIIFNFTGFIYSDCVAESGYSFLQTRGISLALAETRERSAEIALGCRPFEGNLFA